MPGLRFPGKEELQRRLLRLDIRCPMCNEYFWSGRQRQEHLVAQHGWRYRLPRNNDRPHKGFCHCGRNAAHARGLCTSCITREWRSANGVDNDPQEVLRLKKPSPTHPWRD